jgi:hypothetical protein
MPMPLRPDLDIPKMNAAVKDMIKDKVSEIG